MGQLPSTGLVLQPSNVQPRCSTFICPSFPEAITVSQIQGDDGTITCEYQVDTGSYLESNTCLYDATGTKTSGSSDCSNQATCTACNTGYPPQNGMCSACPPTFTRTESGACSLYCSGGQVIFGTDTTATCVACDDPRILSQTAGTIALGVVAGRCQATSCKPGYGLGTGLSPNGDGTLNAYTGCEPCRAGTYSLGGPTACTSCATGATSARQATSCTCSRGYSYGSASLSPSGAECTACTGNTYGLGGDQQCMPCAAGSTGAAGLERRSGRDETGQGNTLCRCSAGYSGTNIPVSGEGCTACSGNTYSVEGASQCTACSSNTTPADDHSACYCSAGYGLTDGSCVECSLDTVNPGGIVNNQVCLPCEAPLMPTYGQTGCSVPATMRARAKARRKASEADRVVAARQYKYPIVR